MSSNPELAEQFRLTGQVAIVTGGAGLLGVSHSRTLAQAGATVVIADLRADQAGAVAREIQDETGAEVLAIETDVSQPQSVKQMVAATLDQFSRIDILVNNAAIDPKFDADTRSSHTTSFEEFPYADWQQALAVNIGGMFLSAQAACKAMLERKHGVVVNISSTYGLVGPDQRLYAREGMPPQFKPVTYSVSKAAVLGLTRYLATYYAGKGIRVNALTPGGVFADHDDEFVKRYSAKTVLGRMAEKEEISSALLFLVSKASSYMTGANLVVDGGWTAW
jgi:2-deoxy-D-gluconate 3-dehydrogenase